MSHSKPLLIPWLRSQVDSGRYPGVAWTNPQHTEFCVPWKHALRQDSSRVDVLIFKAWAEVSGNGRAQGDPSVWKRNFRSALRAKGFKLVSDNKNDAANPHKVFSWPEEAPSGASSSAGSQDQEEPNMFEHLSFPKEYATAVLLLVFLNMMQTNQYLSAESTIDQDILEECLKGMNIEPPTEGITVFESPPEQQQQHNQGVIGGHVLPEQQQYPVAFEDAVGGVGLPEQPAYPMDGAVGVACDQQMVEQFKDTMSKTMVGDHFKTQFRVLVYYRGVKVSEQLVENEAGLRLVYRPELTQPVLDHETGLFLVSLPRPVAMLDHTQANLTQRILDKLGQGLEVGVSGPVVYGQRLGEIKAFWSLCKFDHSRQPQEVSKLEPQPLYLFKDFVRGMLDFITGKECPPCSLYFCLGEKWPDPDNRPLEKKLITVEVVLTSLEILKSMAVGGGASSLHSVELQISLEEMMELC
uniref:Interferon regulatory factor 3 n=1 Tax=Myripristis murdjan TaxID=586833 RepID=A0A667WVN4_9TELE